MFDNSIIKLEVLFFVPPHLPYGHPYEKILETPLRGAVKRPGSGDQRSGDITPQQATQGFVIDKNLQCGLNFTGSQ